jgi:hypothetical protein
MDHYDSLEPSLSRLDSVRQESPLRDVPGAHEAENATLLSYKRAVESLEEEVATLRKSLEHQKRTEHNRLKLELARQAEKHRQDVETLRATYDRESEMKQQSLMDAISSKHAEDLNNLRVSYELKLSKAKTSRSSDGLLSAFEQNYFKSKSSDRYVEKPSLSLLDDDSQLIMEVEESDLLSRILLEKENSERGEEDTLANENRRLREALSTALNSSASMCSKCKKLASASVTLDSYLTSLKYLEDA